VEAQLMKEYPKMLGIPEEKFRLARKAGEIKPEVRDVKAVLKEMPRMKGETGEVVGDYLSRHTDVTVGGSVAQRTQVSGRTPRDIDLFTNQPQARATELYNALIRAGVPAKLQIVGSGEKLSGKIFVSGYKLAEFHTTTWLASFPFYAGTTETPEGVKVIKISEQLYRKTIGGITREKDIADFQSAVKSLIRTGEIKAEKGISLLRPYRESKVAELKQLAFGVKGYASFKTPDISKAPLITPTLSMATPEYKPTKPLKISKVSYTPPKAAEVSYPVLTSKTAKYPAIVRKPTAKYPTTKPKKITEYPALLKKITAEYPPLLKPAKYPAYPLKAPMALTLARHEPKKYERKKYYGAPITQPSIELYGRLGARDRYPKIRVGKRRRGEVLLMPKADWISIQKEEMRTGRKAKHPAITRLTRKEYARRLHGPGAAALRFPTARGWRELTKKGRKESLLLLKPKKRRKKR